MRRVYEVEVIFQNGKVIKEEITAPKRADALTRFFIKHKLEPDPTNQKVNIQYKGTLGSPDEPDEVNNG